MAFAHAPLSEAEAGPAVWKVCGPDAPAPMKAMAARGLAPLPPRDLLVVLYQFWVTPGGSLGDEAGRTLAGLPEGVLFGALGDRTVPAGVVDFVGRKFPRSEGVLQRVVQHPNVHDESLAGLARICPESICDILAENQERWMRFPVIVEALYQNPNCRMSVAHRMLELCVRQGIDVKLPNMEEIKAALGEGAAPSDSDDARFRGMMGGKVQTHHDRVVEQVQRGAAQDEVDYDAIEGQLDEGLDIEALLATPIAGELSLPMEGEDDAPTPPQETEANDPDEPAEKSDKLSLISRLPTMQKIRLAMLGSAFERSVLIRDSNKQVCMSAIKSPRVMDNEAIAYSANRALSHDVVRYIAQRRDWVKLYQVKYNLVVNPKTPLSSAMTLLGKLFAHDVRKIARSRNISSALATAAKRKEAARR